MPSSKAPPPVYRLRITLLGIEPPIWRVIDVPSSMKLCCVHTAFQIVIGWTDSHLHQFERDGLYWGVPELYEDDDIDVADEDETRLQQVFESEGESLIYVYDFGDDWRHEVVLEQIIPVNEPAKAPVCIDGARRCPPEDVGSISGYEEFLKVIFDPAHEEYEHFVGWAGGHFHDVFDAKAVNEKLSRMKWPIRHRR